MSFDPMFTLSFFNLWNIMVDSQKEGGGVSLMIGEGIDTFIDDPTDLNTGRIPGNEVAFPLDST